MSDIVDTVRELEKEILDIKVKFKREENKHQTKLDAKERTLAKRRMELLASEGVFDRVEWKDFSVNRNSGLVSISGRVEDIDRICCVFQLNHHDRCEIDHKWSTNPAHIGQGNQYPQFTISFSACDECLSILYDDTEHFLEFCKKYKLRLSEKDIDARITRVREDIGRYEEAIRGEEKEIELLLKVKEEIQRLNKEFQG